jgi:hypothetical protein
VSHAAMDDEALFWFVVALTLLLLILVLAVIKTRPEDVRSARPPPPSPLPLPPPPMVAARPRAPGGPPWEPAPMPPDLGLLPHAQNMFGPAGVGSRNSGRSRSVHNDQGRTWSGGRTGAHRRRARHGAHRADSGMGRAPGSGSRAGRHRAGVR